MQSTEKSISIDFFPESASRYRDFDAIVCLDILRSSSTLVSAVAAGRRAFAAGDHDEACRIAGELEQPLLAGAEPRPGTGRYEIADSPSALLRRSDLWRPLVLTSSSGTRLLARARGCRSVFVASLRNLTATADQLASGYRKVALLGACAPGSLRCEDQIAAARLGKLLEARGFAADWPGTAATVERWGSVDLSLIRLGRSAEGLLRAGQREDLELILSQVDDLDFACEASGAELHRRVPGRALALERTASAAAEGTQRWFMTDRGPVPFYAGFGQGLS